MSDSERPDLVAFRELAHLIGQLGDFLRLGRVEQTHLDAQLLWDPLATSSCYHGVTTVIPGNCGLSLAPCKEQDRETILKSFERVEAITLPALKAGVKWGFTAFGEYLDALRGHLGINVASLVGHCALRQFVMGEASIERAATAAEIHQMKEVLKASVRAGAAGFSTNQNPVHMYADGTPIWGDFDAQEIFGKLMSISDELMWRYYRGRQRVEQWRARRDVGHFIQMTGATQPLRDV